MSDLIPYLDKAERELAALFDGSPIQPRPYQVEAIASLDLYWDNHTGEIVNPLFWLATGLGKTVLFSMLIRLYYERYKSHGLTITILAGNKELIEQAEQKVYLMFPNAPVGVYCASMNRKEIAPITIASRGSIANNVHAFGYQSLLIVDECDEIPESETSQYKKIIAKLREFNPSMRVIGFTATPFWAKDVIYKDGSKKDDKKIFDHVVYKRDLRWGIENGFLVQPTTRAVQQGEIDTSKIKISNGDFNAKELEQASAKHELVEGAVKEWHSQAFLNGRQLSVFFCTSIKHAEMVSASLLDNFGIVAPVVHGGTPKKEREIVLEQMRQNRLTAVCNVNVLTRGTDVPAIDCLALLRATNSLRLIIQIVGRGLRPDDGYNQGKKDCLILDFGENCKRFGQLDKAMPPKRKGDDDRVVPCKACSELISPFVHNCPACGAPQRAKPSKICAICEEPNPIGAKVCVNCQEPFITHKAAAAHGALISSENMIQEFPVDKVEFSVATARSNNMPYVKISYFSERFNVYFRPIFLGWISQHTKALTTWREVTTFDFMPSDAHQAVEMTKANPEHIRKPKSIRVDMASKYRDILEVIYND